MNKHIVQEKTQLFVGINILDGLGLTHINRFDPLLGGNFSFTHNHFLNIIYLESSTRTPLGTEERERGLGSWEWSRECENGFGGSGREERENKELEQNRGEKENGFGTLGVYGERERERESKGIGKVNGVYSVR